MIHVTNVEWDYVSTAFAAPAPPVSQGLVIWKEMRWDDLVFPSSGYGNLQ